MLTATSYDARYYDEHREAGLDYAVYGDWQRNYGRWFVESLGLRGRLVLDAGCACGAIAQGIQDAGAFACVGVDLCEHMLAIGRQRFPYLKLWTCDAINLHHFPDACFDAIHSAQSAEHWRPEYVPLILAELHRVTRPGGLLFVCLDTVELFERQGRDVLKEDPTHVCIRPREWWHDRLSGAGWRDDTDQHATTLERHPLRPANDWDYFVLRKDSER